jgi:molybdopterin-guanine dinucleotide biosynthesis protein A
VTAASWSLGVLAGGQGARLGGDKAARPFGASSLLGHAIARYAPAGSPVLVSTPARGAPVPAGATAVPDSEPGLGPLAGIAALLARAATPWLLVVPVDLPLFPPRCGEALAAAAGEADGVVLAWRGRVEPFPALIARGLAGPIDALLQRGLRRADSWHAHVRCRIVPFETVFPDSDGGNAFFNVNTPDDLARAEALLASEGR